MKPKFRHRMNVTNRKHHALVLEYEGDFGTKASPPTAKLRFNPTKPEFRDWDVTVVVLEDHRRARLVVPVQDFIKRNPAKDEDEKWLGAMDPGDIQITVNTAAPITLDPMPMTPVNGNPCDPSV